MAHPALRHGETFGFDGPNPGSGGPLSHGYAARPSQDSPVDVFFLSTAVVAVAEIGDKTQLLALMLVARFAKPIPIIAGIAIATLANHSAAAAIGFSAANLVDGASLRWIVGLSFFAMAAWALIPDKADERGCWYDRLGAFGATLISFFLVEIGDKTQIATVALAARYDAMVWVTAGTTVGMLVANIPVVLLGKMAAERLPLKAVRIAAAAVFAVLGAATLYGPLSEIIAGG
jgi:putative Ca2+/H+ antiporter (TMEM165/GDT1 family)